MPDSSPWQPTDYESLPVCFMTGSQVKAPGENGENGVASCISTFSPSPGNQESQKKQDPVLFRVTGFKALFSWHPLVQVLFVGTLTRCRQRTNWKNHTRLRKKYQILIGNDFVFDFHDCGNQTTQPCHTGPDPVSSHRWIPAFAGMTSEAFFVACPIMSVGWKQERG